MIKLISREDVEACISKGMTNKEIAREVGCALKSLDNCLAKWGISKKQGDANEARLALLEEIKDFCQRMGIGVNKLSIASGLNKDAIRRMRNIKYGGNNRSTIIKIRNAMKEIENAGICTIRK